MQILFDMYFFDDKMSEYYFFMEDCKEEVNKEQALYIKVTSSDVFKKIPLDDNFNEKNYQIYQASLAEKEASLAAKELLDAKKRQQNLIKNYQLNEIQKVQTDTQYFIVNNLPNEIVYKNAQYEFKLICENNIITQQEKDKQYLALQEKYKQNNNQIFLIDENRLNDLNDNKKDKDLIDIDQIEISPTKNNNQITQSQKNQKKNNSCCVLI